MDEHDRRDGRGVPNAIGRGRGDEAGHERAGRDEAGRSGRATSRRGFLKAASAGAVAGAVGLAGVGAGAARGVDLQWLDRDGNLLRDQQDQRVVLRGVNVVDPARADQDFWRRPVPETVDHATDPERGWHSRVIRVPCAPGELMGGSEDGDPGVLEEAGLEDFLANLLDPVVEKCREVGAYCIVDYHRHQTDDYTQQALHDELTLFWETVAPRYAEDSHVLFEVYNEPITPYAGQEQSSDVSVLDDAAEETWQTWKETAQPWVDTIREHAPRNVVIIGSPRWSQWTYWAPHDEFAGDNLAYAGHVYAHPNLRPLGDYFGDPADEVPVFMSEFGYQNERHDGRTPNEHMKGTTDVEGQQFKEFFEAYDSVHWQVWCFDHSWSPPMFDFDDATHEWSLMSGNDWHGKFFKEYLAEKRTDDLPGEGIVTATPTEPDGQTPTESTGTVEGGPVPVGENDAAPTDPDDDGLYEDVNGNGDGDLADAVDLYQHRHADAVTNHTAAYDFSGNEEIDLADVVELYQENAN